METESNPNKHDKPISSELRLGLATSGAIALVLYESGVAHEIHRFLSAWEKGKDAGGYAEAFNRIPIRPVVDILTGASAGGINSIFLASCISTGQDFGNFHDLWIDLAGVDTLRYSSREVAPSLMSVAPLRQAMAEQLRINAQKAPTQSPAGGIGADLLVRLCRTEVESLCLRTRDALGHEIDVDSRSNVISFDGSHFRRTDDTGKPVEAVIKTLTDAALATSAFPVAFPPVLDTVENRWYIDGGLWNNQPINLAVRAVRDKPALLRTHRCILFIEPNPSRRLPDAENSAQATEAKKAPPEPALAQVAVGLPFLGLKGTIWPAVEDILGFNRRAAIYSDLESSPTARRFAREMGRRLAKDSREQIEAAWASDTAFEKPLTILNKLRADVLLFDSDEALLRRWDALLTALHAQDRITQPTEDIGPYAEMALRSLLRCLGSVGEADLRRLRVRAEIDQLNRAITSSEGMKRRTGQNATAEVAHDTAIKAGLYARLERLNDYLHADPHKDGLDDRLSPDIDRSRFRAATEVLLDKLDDEAQRGVGHGLTTAGGIKAVVEVLDKTLSDWEKAIATAADAGRTRFPFEEGALDARRGDGKQGGDAPVIYSLLKRQQVASGTNGRDPNAFDHAWAQAQAFVITTARRHEEAARVALAECSAAGDQDGAAEAQAAAEESKQAAEAPWDPTDSLYTLYVLGAVSDVPGKSSIDLVRVSPNDTNNLHLIPPDGKDGSKVTPAVRKLAGEGLGHLTGFLQSRWRRNDYIWGRLDACEILLRALCAYGEKEGRWSSASEEDQQLYATWLKSAQDAILQDERQKYLKGSQGTQERSREYEALYQRSPDLAKRRPEELSKVGGVPCKLQSGMSSAEQEIQNANALLIGYGSEGVADADEPNFSHNVDYLAQTAVRVARGNTAISPARLDSLSRALRIASVPLEALAAVAPGRGNVRSVWRLFALVLLLLGIIFAVGWGMGSGALATAGTALFYGLIAAAFLVACGCGLGYRLGAVTPLAFALGYLCAALPPLWPLIWGRDFDALWARPDGWLVTGAAVVLLLCLLYVLFKIAWNDRPGSEGRKALSP